MSYGAKIDADAIEKKIQRMRTAPFDPRYPNCNQTRHCWQNYVDFHRCNKKLPEKGEDPRVCEWFRLKYKAVCPNAWTDKWDDQRDNGTFAGKI